MRIRATVLWFLLPVLFLPGSASAADWPCLGGDADRSGVTDEQLRPPLNLVWMYRASHPPSPAFRGGLRLPTMTEAIAYDHAFHTVVADGRLYFGSSTEEAVFCLDARTGHTEWVYYTEGPVRLAPTIWDGMAYFGSDDGNVYCLDAKTGELVWKFWAASSPRRCIGNGRIISAWPVRTGVTISDGTAYFAAGILPPQGVYLYSLEADTGRQLWRREIPYSPNGQILVDGDKLWLPTGRTCPAEFSRTDGTPLIDDPDLRRAQGGAKVRKVRKMVLYGPCESGMLHLRVADERLPAVGRGYPRGMVSGTVVTVRGRSAVAGDLIVLVRDDEILAIEPGKFREAALRGLEADDAHGPGFRRPQGISAGGQFLRESPAFYKELQEQSSWRAPNVHGLTSVALAGDALCLGGEKRVVALAADSGRELWSHAVEGVALGLAVADGALFASTDLGRIYCFAKGAVTSPPTHVSSPRSPYPDDPLYAEAASTALQHAGTTKGFCLVLGVGDGQLAYEIARRSDLTIVALDRDASRVEAARQKLTLAGIYGSRVVVQHVPDDDPPYVSHFANLIVSDECLTKGTVPYAPSAIPRMLRPYGGAIVLGGRAGTPELSDWRAEDLSPWEQLSGPSDATWRIARRGPLDGAGEWSHLYADPANTVCSNDRLVGTDLRIQWSGPPGAEDVVDRHNIAMPPLFKNGRLFYAGLHNTLRAVDAYNGTPLWKIEAPGSVRQLISHNAGFVCAAAEHVFMASEKTCWMLDAGTGQTVHVFGGPNEQSDWGHVAVQGDYLLGSNQKPEVSAMAAAGIRDFVNARISKSRVAVSENLFALNYRTRELLWTYTGGVILNPTITMGGETVYFAESRNQTCVNDPTGTADMKDFVARDASIVALDLKTGAERWRKPIPPNTSEAQWIMYLSYADGILLSTRTYWLDDHLTYELKAVDAATGRDRWTQQARSPVTGPYAPLINGKNMQAAHPSIVNGKVHWLAHTFGTMFSHDLRTGATDHDTDFGMQWQNKGCAVPTASASALYYRDTSCHMYDLATRTKIDLTQVTRPGCWMSIIPAGGLVLMPEASSGCTCGFALQMSVVMAPK